MADRIMPCPHCGKNYNISTFEPGMKFKCTQCGNVVTVPGGDTGRAAREPRREPKRPSAGGRSRGPAPERSRGGGGGRSRRGFDEDDMDDRRGRGVPRKKDNTTMYAILGAVAFLVVVGLVLSVFKSNLTNPTTPPPDATPSDFSGVYGTAKVYRGDVTPPPVKTLITQTPYVSDGKTITPPPIEVEVTPEPSKNTPAPTKKASRFASFSDCSQEVRDFINDKISVYGGKEALKENNSLKLSVLFENNLSLDRNINPDDPMYPFSWEYATSNAGTLAWKRAGGTSKLFTAFNASSLIITTCWNGKDLNKYKDKNKVDSDAIDLATFKNDAFDMDIMYKLGEGFFKFQDEVATSKNIKLHDFAIKVDYLVMKDVITERQYQLCFYNDPRYSDWKGLPAMLTYKDESISAKFHKYYWNYNEKNGMKFAQDTLSVRRMLDEDGKEIKEKQPFMSIVHIFKENEEEGGSIEIGHDLVADYLFDKPAD